MKTTNEARGVSPEHTVRCNGTVDMEAFDRLPKVLRHALNYAPGPVSAKECAEAMREGIPPMMVVSFVQEAGNDHYGRPDDGLCETRHRPCRR